MVKSIGKKLKNLAIRFQKDEAAQMHSVSAMYAVVFLIVLVFIAIVLFTFIPGMGSTIATSVPAPPAYYANSTAKTGQQAGGEWNTSDTNNPNQAALASASGVSLWTSSSGMFKIAIIIIILALVIAALLGMLQLRRQQGGGGSPM